MCDYPRAGLDGAPRLSDDLNVTTPILDTTVEVETPEGIVLELRPAGFVARFYAFLIDFLIRVGLFWAAFMVTLPLGGLGAGFALILFFALEWFYPVIFELSRGGATLGKRAMGLKVVMDNGLPITPAASLTRNLLRTADFLPFLYGFGLLSMLLRKDFKRLGDLAAATLVVYQSRPVASGTLEQLQPLAPTRPLSARDQAAVIALATRAPRLNRERLDELAALAGAVSGDEGHSGPEVTRRVLAVAQWLLGRRG
jgi:uncharacterized RDD family membrane protein YckC